MARLGSGSAEGGLGLEGHPNPDPNQPPHLTHDDMDLADVLQRTKEERDWHKRDATKAWKQVADMKKFLNDYGMVWMGTDDPDKYAEVSDAHGNAIPGNNNSKKKIKV